MRNGEFFTSYVRPLKKTSPWLKGLIQFNISITQIFNKFVLIEGPFISFI